MARLTRHCRSRPLVAVAVAAAVLTVAACSDDAGRSIEAAYWDGTAIVAVSSADTGTLGSTEAIVRLGADGTIVQESPATGAFSIFDTASVGGRTFAFTYDGVVCGIQEIDPTTLVLGPAVAFPTDDFGGCGGRISNDATAIFASDVASPDAFRVDVASGQASRTPGR